MHCLRDLGFATYAPLMLEFQTNFILFESKQFMSNHPAFLHHSQTSCNPIRPPTPVLHLSALLARANHHRRLFQRSIHRIKALHSHRWEPPAD